MKDHDYGFYGSGLDGYVHYRQGMAEAERNAPHSGDSYASDTPSGEPTDSYSSPVRKPVRTAPAPSQSVSTLTAVKKWLCHPCNLAWIISWVLFLTVSAVDSACNTVTTMYAAFYCDVVVIILSVVEILRFGVWIFCLL